MKNVKICLLLFSGEIYANSAFLRETLKLEKLPL
jgi:hypothetical protein